MKNLLLVDGNALFYRAYFAFPKELTTPDGQPSGASFGFTRILLAAIRNLKPTHVMVCFDTKGGTFRDALYDGYKATRAAMPDDLLSQVPAIWELVDTLEAPRYTLEGFEADDLIGTLARQAETHPDLQVTILSGDQDLLQLVTDRVSVYSPAIGFQKAMLYTPATVQEKYGFSPIQMIDYKALRGDASDNIPGVPGIGEVTAKQLLAAHHSINQLFADVAAGKTEGIKPGVLKKLIESEDLSRLSYTLATIKIDVPITLDLPAGELQINHPERLVTFFEKMGFKSLINELPKSHKLVSAAADVFSSAPEPTGENASEALDTSLAPILRDMERYGVQVDVAYLKTLEDEYAAEAAALVKQLHDLAGQPFNPDSPAQVATILYDVLHIPTDRIAKGKTGFTTNAETLEKLSAEYPIATLLLKYREIPKLQSTYVKPLQEQVDAAKRVHTSYAPDTATGRISSRYPNLQNIPVRSEEGRRIRQAFVAPKGYLLLAADYSQIELRVAAHLSQDPVMLDAFRTGKDFHAETAAKMDVDRRVAKIINFSILYGKGAFGFANDLGISMAEAKAYIEQYFKTFAGLRRYIDTLLEEARANGYVTTALGRKRFLPELTASNFQHRTAAEREAVNLPIQGTAAEILKLAMLALAKALKPEDGRMILTVHDELVLEIPEEKLEHTAALLKKVMTEAYTLDVPLEVQVKSGRDWANLKPF